MAEKKTAVKTAAKASAKKTTKVKKVVKAKPVVTAVAGAPSVPKTKKFNDFIIYTKRSGRFAVVGKNGKNVNGFDKAKVLVEAKMNKHDLPKKAPPPVEAPAAEPAAPAAE